MKSNSLVHQKNVTMCIQIYLYFVALFEVKQWRPWQKNCGLHCQPEGIMVCHLNQSVGGAEKSSNAKDTHNHSYFACYKLLWKQINTFEYIDMVIFENAIS